MYSFLDDDHGVGSLGPQKKGGEDIAGLPVASSVAGALLSTNQAGSKQAMGAGLKGSRMSSNIKQAIGTKNQQLEEEKGPIV